MKWRVLCYILVRPVCHPVWRAVCYLSDRFGLQISMHHPVSFQCEKYHTTTAIGGKIKLTVICKITFAQMTWTIHAWKCPKMCLVHIIRVWGTHFSLPHARPSCLDQWYMSIKTATVCYEIQPIILTTLPLFLVSLYSMLSSLFNPLPPWSSTSFHPACFSWCLQLYRGQHEDHRHGRRCEGRLQCRSDPCELQGPGGCCMLSTLVSILRWYVVTLSVPYVTRTSDGGKNVFVFVNIIWWSLNPQIDPYQKREYHPSLTKLNCLRWSLPH